MQPPYTTSEILPYNYLHDVQVARSEAEVLQTFEIKVKSVVT